MNSRSTLEASIESPAPRISNISCGDSRNIEANCRVFSDCSATSQATLIISSRRSSLGLADLMSWGPTTELNQSSMPTSFATARSTRDLAVLLTAVTGDLDPGCDPPTSASRRESAYIIRCVFPVPKSPLMAITRWRGGALLDGLNVLANSITASRTILISGVSTVAARMSCNSDSGCTG